MFCSFSHKYPKLWKGIPPKDWFHSCTFSCANGTPELLGLIFPVPRALDSGWTHEPQEWIVVWIVACIKPSKIPMFTEMRSKAGILPAETCVCSTERSKAEVLMQIGTWYLRIV